MHNKIFILVCFFANLLFAQNTVGTIVNETESYSGYTLFTPYSDHTVQLIDNEGRVINTWKHPDLSRVDHAMLLENGLLLRSVYVNNSVFQGMSLTHGRLELVEWDGTVIWSYEHSSDYYLMHHDFNVIYQDDGSVNILATSYDRMDLADAVNEGRNPEAIGPDGFVLLDKIIEIKPNLENNSGEIIWEWHAKNHLVQEDYSDKNNYIENGVASNPQLFNFNYFKNAKHNTSADWMHLNGISYHTEYDQILASNHGSNQFFIIDHSTTTQEAAAHSGGNSGKGGDLLYRYGNPLSYGASGEVLYESLHDVHWIPEGLNDAGKIMVFNNGFNSGASSIHILTPPESSPGVYVMPSAGEAFGPSSDDWIYENGSNFWSKNMGNAQRLPNGNTLINESINGRFFEVNSLGEIVWNYMNPLDGDTALNYNEVYDLDVANYNNKAFKAFKYAANYSGLAGQDLTPKAPLEQYLSVTIKEIEDGKSFNWQGIDYSQSGVYIKDGNYLSLLVIGESTLINIPMVTESQNQIIISGNVLYLNLSETQKGTLNIYNISGKLMYSNFKEFKTGTHQFSIDYLSQGNYFAHFIGKNGTFSFVFHK